MTYYELFTKAENLLIKNKITLGEYEEMVQPLNEEERKEGEWIKVKSARGGYECSECHNYAPSYQGGGEHLSNFCPNCGAKMYEDDKDIYVPNKGE